MEKDVSFSDLGMPFPLFDAPVKFAERFVRNGSCSICERASLPVFELGIGSDVVYPCTNCGSDTIFDKSGEGEVKCASCGSWQIAPVDLEESVQCCYDCLRSGKAAITQDTEFGMVRLEDAQRGWTHGTPHLEATSYQLRTGQDGWVQVKIDTDRLLDLVRTPSYSTWQGVRWLFCCGGPMTYLGEWNQQDFCKHAVDGDGAKLYEQMSGDFRADSWTFDDLESRFPGKIYAFRCTACEGKRLNADME